MRIVFLGSSDFGIPALEEIMRRGDTIAGIVTTPASQKGRGRVLTRSPMSVFAEKKGILPVFTPESLNEESFTADLRKLAADVFIVVAYKVLPESVFTIPSMGTYNIHASILPKYRGPAPIQRAIAAGEKETGVTVFRIDRGVDTGAVVVTRTTSIGDDETTPQLSSRLSGLGAAALSEALTLVQEKRVEFKAQDNSRACGAPKLKKDEGLIRWDMPGTSIFNMIRAFKPFPGTYSFLDTMRVNIEWGTPAGNDSGGQYGPGTICSVDTGGFFVQCGSGRLHVESVRPEGKKSMNARDFANGRGITPGTRLL